MGSRLRRTLVVATIMLSGVPLRPAEADSPAEQSVVPVGEQVADFQLRDGYGSPHALDDYRDARIVVVAFLGTECPLVRLYASRLGQLADTYHDQSVVFLGINSNTQDSMTELVAFAQRYSLTFPLLKDTTHAVADQLGATRTPEVIVLDAERRIRYRGRVDDQYAIGTARPQPQCHDLQRAIDQLLAGQPVAVPSTEVVGCVIGRTKRPESRGAITYNHHIAEIMNRRCVECHRDGQIAPFPLTRYDDTLGWGETIREVVEQLRMPPWNANPDHGTFSNDSRLTSHEKQLLFDWIDNGMPEGDGTPPPLPRFAEGWRIATPDQIIFMNQEQQPFPVPAEGIVDYQYFRVDPGWTEDKYIAAAEAKPGNTAVVHHIIAYVWPPGARQFQLDAMLVGYAPGAPPTTFDAGEAMFVPAGSDLVFEVHYTPNGTAQDDLSCVGVQFIDKANVRELVRGRLAINERFRIPPQSPDYEVTASHKIARDSLLLTMSPHMHLRGKSFTFEALYPDGSQEILLDVPHYDFNWQLTYRLAEPKRLPKGTTVRCTAIFDNSADNLANPDPTATVTWGEQSWEEMMIGFFDVKPAPPEGLPAATEDPTGEWTWTQDVRGRSQTSRLRLQFSAPHTVLGVYEGIAGRHEVQNGRLYGRELSLEVPLLLDGRQMVAVLHGTMDDDTLEGTISLANGFGGHDLPWQATRSSGETLP